jgi:hypothetical protein
MPGKCNVTRNDGVGHALVGSVDALVDGPLTDERSTASPSAHRSSRSPSVAEGREPEVLAAESARS